MRKRVSISVIDKRPRTFAQLFDEALRKKSIDSFGGIPANALDFGDLIGGLPENINDPGGNGDGEHALPPRVHTPDEDFLQAGDTIFEELTVNGSVYEASLPVDFYRDVWFDGLQAEPSAHYTVSSEAIKPVDTLASSVRVTAKYVLAG